MNAFRGVSENIFAARSTRWDLNTGHLFVAVLTERSQGSTTMTATGMTVALQGALRVARFPNQHNAQCLPVKASRNKLVRG